MGNIDVSAMPLSTNATNGGQTRTHGHGVCRSLSIGAEWLPTDACSSNSLVRIPRLIDIVLPSENLYSNPMPTVKSGGARPWSLVCCDKDVSHFLLYLSYSPGVGITT